MNKWSEIKTGILNKLFLDAKEADMEGYTDKMQYLANECLVLIANDAKENIKTFDFEVVKELPEDNIDNYYQLINSKIKMPSDFISFEGDISYVGRKYPKLFFFGRDVISPLFTGKYSVLYYAYYPEITKDNVVSDSILDIDKSVLECIPTYVASQLLGQNDPQRAAILRNEFEVLVNRLDNYVVENINTFNSEGGWY